MGQCDDVVVQHALGASDLRINGMYHRSRKEQRKKAAKPLSIVTGDLDAEWM